MTRYGTETDKSVGSRIRVSGVRRQDKKDDDKGAFFFAFSLFYVIINKKGSAARFA